ncbi:MAG: S41 family peptidase, partial [Lachnospiraceae bacterium]|nr:S41 family peptidase [Candidatus Minthocola equi]
DILDNMYTGLVEGLGDPYSVYYSADMLESKNEEMQGNYCGIGAMITIDTTTMEKSIVNVYENSPAEVGGLIPGDIIVAVDDVDVTHMNLDDTVALIKGPEGTKVTIKVIRDGTGLEFHLTRANVVMNHTKCSMITEDIGLIELSEFYENATEQMEEGINFLKENGAKQIILDLRGNPGGLFNAAIDIADMFLDSGVIVSEADKNGNHNYHYATEGTIFDGDLVILVNENSASSSEILTAALSQHGRAVVIGTKTFGKGIVQTVYTLTDGTAVKLTTDYYYTPNGTCIHDIGIEPDINVPESEDPDVDAPLEKAIEYLMQLR